MVVIDLIKQIACVPHELMCLHKLLQGWAGLSLLLLVLLEHAVLNCTCTVRP